MRQNVSGKTRNEETATARKATAKEQTQLIERTDLIRKNVHRRYLPWLFRLLIIMAIVFGLIDVVLALYYGGPPGVLLVAVAAQAIIVATLVGVWTSLFNAEVVSTTSAHVALAMETKIDELLNQSRAESKTAILEQRKYTEAVVSALRERSAEEIEILRQVAGTLDDLKEALGKQSEELAKLEEAERERTEALQRAQQEQIQVAQRQIDLTVRQARPILNLRLWAKGIITQDIQMSISPSANDVHNVAVSVTAQPPGRRPIEWRKRAGHIPAGAAKVWNLGDVGKFPKDSTPIIFSITYEDKLGTPYQWETRATVRRWGILGKGFRAIFE